MKKIIHSQKLLQIKNTPGSISKTYFQSISLKGRWLSCLHFCSLPLMPEPHIGWDFLSPVGSRLFPRHWDAPSDICWLAGPRGAVSLPSLLPPPDTEISPGFRALPSPALPRCLLTVWLTAATADAPGIDKGKKKLWVMRVKGSNACTRQVMGVTVGWFTMLRASLPGLPHLIIPSFLQTPAMLTPGSVTPKSAPSASTSLRNGESWSHASHDGEGSLERGADRGNWQGRDQGGKKMQELLVRREEAPPRCGRSVCASEVILHTVCKKDHWELDFQDHFIWNRKPKIILDCKSRPMFKKRELHLLLWAF